MQIEAFFQPPIEGVVLQSYGAGNVPDNRDDFIKVFAKASSRGVLIVNCTQCLVGTVRGIYATNQVQFEHPDYFLRPYNQYQNISNTVGFRV